MDFQLQIVSHSVHEDVDSAKPTLKIWQQIVHTSLVCDMMSGLGPRQLVINYKIQMRLFSANIFMCRE